jgi:hypothetical protein
MVNLITSPDAVTLTRNTALYKLKSVNGSGQLFRATGVKSEVDFSASSNRLSAAATITIAYTEPDGTMETVIFTATNTPTGVADLPSGAVSGYNNTTYWAAVANIIGTHPRIAPFFTAVILSTKITIQERTAAAGWALVVTNSASYTVTDTAATTDTTPDNYRVTLQVFAEYGYKTGAYELVSEHEGLPDENGLMFFDISQVLDALGRDMVQEPAIPLYANAVPVRANNTLRYYVRFREQSGTPVTYQDWTYDAVKIAVLGGVANSIWAEANYLLTLDVSNALLSWQVDGRLISPEERVYLPWHNYTGSAKRVVLEVIAYSVVTGLADTADFLFESSTILYDAYETALIPAWPSALGITDTTKYRYTVRVVDADSAYDSGEPEYLSQEREYYINRDFSRTERQIMYLNSFGCPECWRCTGEYSKSLEISRSTAQRAIQPGYDQYAADTVQYFTDFNPALTYRTGYVRRADAEVLQEMFLAVSLYDISENGYVPLRITSNGLDVTSSLRDLHSYQFTTQPRLSMGNFSKREVPNAGSDAWQDADLSYWLDTLNQPWTLP